ncbi:MAG: iron-sulfur cluster assembly scaffold protein [bacterium]|nr:iron-sulfur cluster assembly scaffold protein [bacterium]
MEDQLYREVILERFSNPVNQGMLEKPDLEAVLLNPLCGDEVRLQVKLNGTKVSQARFSGNGCAISQVSASLLAEYLEGKNLSAAKKITPDKLLSLLEIKPSPARLSCALLSLETLKKALQPS